MRAEIARIAEPTTLIIPTQADLEDIYRKLGARPESLLTG